MLSLKKKGPITEPQVKAQHTITLGPSVFIFYYDMWVLSSPYPSVMAMDLIRHMKGTI